MKAIEFLRAFARPYTVIAVITTIIGLAVYLSIKFATPEMTRDVVIFLLGAGGTIVGFLFGERASRKKEETPPQ